MTFLVPTGLDAPTTMEGELLPGPKLRLTSRLYDMVLKPGEPALRAIEGVDLTVGERVELHNAGFGAIKGVDWPGQAHEPNGRA